MGDWLTPIVTVVGSVTVLVVLIEHPQIILNALQLIQRTITGVVSIGLPHTNNLPGGASTVGG